MFSSAGLSLAAGKINSQAASGMILQDHRRLPVNMIFQCQNRRFTLIKKENKFFLILVFKEIQMGSGAKSYMKKGVLKYEEIRKYITIYED